MIATTVDLLECICYTAVVTIDLSISGVRCKPSSYSSAAVRQLCHHQREATSISGVSFAGHTAAASCEWRTMFSFKKRHVPTYLSSCPLLPFFWPPRRRKSYFQPMRHETLGALNHATRYRRSCSTQKNRLCRLWGEAISYDETPNIWRNPSCQIVISNDC